MKFNVNMGRSGNIIGQLAVLLSACSLAAFSSDATARTATGFEIRASEPSAVAGDAVSVAVVQTFSDGSTGPLPSGATVSWSAPDAVQALSPDSTADSPLPAAGDAPTAAFISIPSRADVTDALGTSAAATNEPLTTQDFADMYAFLDTQSQ